VSAQVDTRALGRKLAGATGMLAGVVAADALGLALLARGKTPAGLALIAAPLALPLARRVARRIGRP
jgi:hypothetical protein